MAVSIGIWLGADNAAAGQVDQQPIQHRLHLGELAGDLTAQSVAVAEFLRLHTLDNLLGLLDQVIEVVKRKC